MTLAEVRARLAAVVADKPEGVQHRRHPDFEQPIPVIAHVEVAADEMHLLVSAAPPDDPLVRAWWTVFAGQGSQRLIVYADDLRRLLHLTGEAHEQRSDAARPGLAESALDGES